MTLGSVLHFKSAYDQNRYGHLATVVNTQQVTYRPYGTTVTLIDLKTANGTEIQWTRAEVSRRLR